MPLPVNSPRLLQGMLAKIFNNHFVISRTTCANSRLPTDIFVFILLNPAQKLNKNGFFFVLWFSGAEGLGELGS